MTEAISDQEAVNKAAIEVLNAWDADDVMEKNDLDDRLWKALSELRTALTQLVGGH